MIFQEPMTSLNPVITVGGQIAEVLRPHELGRSQAARAARSSCSTWSASPTPDAGSTTIRTSCRAACASAS